MSASTPNTGPESVHVAVGVVRNQYGEVLITRRPDHVHQGGLWEFPGGKCEAGEDVQSALRRELWEELGIRIQSSSPLVRVRHEYPDRTLWLDVLEVAEFNGEPYGRENQPLLWVRPEQLHQYAFPEADRYILIRLVLPPWYAVMEGEGSTDRYLERLEGLIDQGIRLIYVRARDLPTEGYRILIKECLPATHSAGVCLMVRGSPEAPLSEAGLHLSGRQLRALNDRPDGWRYVAAACHTSEDLIRAEALNLDFAVLSPVQPTSTHPESVPLGWRVAAQWLANVSIPVYLMGGLKRCDLEAAHRHGAQGIAGIRLFAAQGIFDYLSE